MENKRFHILCTRPVATALTAEAMAKGFDTDTIEFIQTNAIKNEALQKQVTLLSEQKLQVIFTSMNAVDAVVDLLGDTKPAWTLFCMGNTTKQLAKKHFGERAIAGTGINATELAQAVIKYSANTSAPIPHVFFCGDQRRDELPSLLAQHQIKLQEITVYQTIETPVAVAKNYDAVLFFSPSAVHSFFSVNTAAKNTTFFAIGDTTATAIKQYSSNQVVVGSTPAKDELFTFCIQHLSQQNDFTTGNHHPVTSN